MTKTINTDTSSEVVNKLEKRIKGTGWFFVFFGWLNVAIHIGTYIIHVFETGLYVGNRACQ